MLGAMRCGQPRDATSEWAGVRGPQRRRSDDGGDPSHRHSHASGNPLQPLPGWAAPEPVEGRSHQDQKNGQIPSPIGS